MKGPLTLSAKPFSACPGLLFDGAHQLINPLFDFVYTKPILYPTAANNLVEWFTNQLRVWNLAVTNGATTNAMLHSYSTLYLPSTQAFCSGFCLQSCKTKSRRESLVQSYPIPNSRHIVGQSPKWQHLIAHWRTKTSWSIMTQKSISLPSPEHCVLYLVHMCIINDAVYLKGIMYLNK